MDKIKMALGVIAFIVVFAAMATIQYTQCIEDGYSKTQCYALMNSNNRMTFVGLDK